MDASSVARESTAAAWEPGKPLGADEQAPRASRRAGARDARPDVGTAGSRW